MTHLRVNNEVGTPQRIRLNLQQLIVGANNTIFKLNYKRYIYYEHNKITYLWNKLSALRIKLDIQGAWRPTLRTHNDHFIMEAFVNKGYTSSVLTVLNNVRVYMKVVVLNNVTIQDGTKMIPWAIYSEINTHNN